MPQIASERTREADRLPPVVTALILLICTISVLATLSFEFPMLLDAYGTDG